STGNTSSAEKTDKGKSPHEGVTFTHASINAQEYRHLGSRHSCPDSAQHPSRNPAPCRDPYRNRSVRSAFRPSECLPPCAALPCGPFDRPWISLSRSRHRTPYG